MERNIYPFFARLVAVVFLFLGFRSFAGQDWIDITAYNRGSGGTYGATQIPVNFHGANGDITFSIVVPQEVSPGSYSHIASHSDHGPYQSADLGSWNTNYISSVWVESFTPGEPCGDSSSCIGGAVVLGYIAVGSTNLPTCMTNVVLTFHNDSQWTRYYSVYVGSVYVGQVFANPSYSTTFSLTTECTNIDKIWYNDHAEEVSNVASNLVSFTGTNFSGSTPNDSVPITYNPTNSSPILFTSTNAVTSQQQGDAALYDAVTKFALQNHQDLQNLKLSNSVNVIVNSTNINNFSVSNFVNFPTNLATSVTVTNVGSSDTNSSGIFSVLKNIYDALTGTNSVSSSISSRLNSLTNSEAVLSAAEGALGDYGIDDVQAGLDSASMPSSPAPPNMTMSFCGQTIDLDPHTILGSSVCSGVRLCVQIVMLLAFFLEVGRLYNETIRTMASTSSGGVPDLDVAGVNLLGFIVALVVPAVIIAFMVTVFTFFFEHIGVSISDALRFSDFTSSLGSIGYYLLDTFVPVNLFFSLVLTRLTLHFSMGKIILIRIAASRILIGK